MQPDLSSRTLCREGMLHRSCLRRAGLSIFEAITLLSLTSFLLVLSVGWIHQSFKLSGAMRVKQRDHLQWTRLARAFRHDGWTASEAVVSAPQKVVFRYGREREVRYEVRDGAMLRSGFDGSDSFAFASGTRLWLRKDQANGLVGLGWARSRGSRQLDRMASSDEPSGPTASDSTEPTSLKVAIAEASEDLILWCQIGRWQTPELAAGEVK